MVASERASAEARTETFGRLLRHYREGAGLAQDRLAERAGLSAPEVRWDWAAIAAVENLVYFGLALWFFQYMYRRSRETGQFARNEE